MKELYDGYVYPNIVSDFEYQFEEHLAQCTNQERSTVTHILNLLHGKGNITRKVTLEKIRSGDTYKLLLKLMDSEFIST